MPADARGLCEIAQRLLNGTRRRSTDLCTDERVSGHVFKPDGPQRSVAEILPVLVEAVSQAELSDTELLVASESLGLAGLPAGLTGGSALPGRVATGGEGRRPKPAARTSITNMLASPRSKIEAAVPSAPGRSLQLHPEPDPATSEWVLSPPALGKRADAATLLAVRRAAYEMSFDLGCRSDKAAGVEAALHDWAALHAGVEVSAAGSVRYGPERRNSAHAVLAICLWDIVHDERKIEAAIRGDPSVSFSGYVPPSVGGRAARHSRWGAMTSGLGWEEFVFLVDDALEGRDAGGSGATLVVDELASGRHDELVAENSGLVWSLGFGLAATGSWRVVELARWYVTRSLTDFTAASLLLWSAHVSSEHGHDGLAWRFASGAERVASRAHGHNPNADRLATVRRNVGLVRAGCRVREAERWFASGEWPDRASTSLIEGRRFLAAVADGASSPRSSHFQLGVGLRDAEIWLVAARMRHAGYPVGGFSEESVRLGRLVSHLEGQLAAPSGVDERDLGIYRGRLAAMRTAIGELGL